MSITDAQWADLAKTHHNSCGLDGARLKAVFAALDDVDDEGAIMGVFNALLGTHGVEHVAHPDPDKGGLDYCNAGETYAVTLAYDEIENEFLVTSWGAWYEAAEQEYEEENGVTRCAYCGEFYDNDGEPCHDENGNTPEQVAAMHADMRNDPESEEDERECLTDEGIDAAEQWRSE